jgi:branched-chain amino acid transport system permease protein
MFDRPRVVLVVGTVGVALFLIAVEGLAFPHQVQLPSIDQALHLSPNLGHIDGVPVAWSDFIQLVVLVVLAVLAFLFFRYTPTGTAILAVSQDPTAARVVGIRVERISMITWGLAGLLGGITGILLAVPPLGAVPGQFTGFTLTAAFAAAVVGGMTSLPGAFVGGLAVGLVKEFANSDALLIPGIQNLKAPDEVTVALFILLVLLLRPRGLLGKEA